MLFQSPYLFIMAPAYFLRLFENWLLFMMLQYFLMRKWSMHININNVLKCIDTHHIDTIVSTEIWSLLVWFWILICTDYLWTCSTNSSCLCHTNRSCSTLWFYCFYFYFHYVFIISFIMWPTSPPSDQRKQTMAVFLLLWQRLCQGEWYHNPEHSLDYFTILFIYNTLGPLKSTFSFH